MNDPVLAIPIPPAVHAVQRSAVSLTFTVFPDVKAGSMHLRSLPWPEFCKDLESPPVFPEKGRCPLIKLATFGEQRTAQGSLRHDKNVLQVTGVELDYDAEEMGIDEAAEKLQAAGIVSCLYTSASHQPDKPRWRVLAPLSRPAHPQERERLLSRLNGALGGIASTESFTLSQSYYYGRVEGVPYEFRRTTGRCIDDLVELDATAIGKPAKEPSPGPAHGPQLHHDYLDELLAGEDVHGNALRLVGRLVKEGLSPDAIRTVMIGLSYGVEEERGPERAADLRGAELDRMIRGGFQKGFHLPDGDAGDSIVVKRLGDIGHNPSTEWVVSGWIPADTVGEVVGPSTVGKTLFMMDIAAHVALGQEWQGNYVEQGAVVFLVGEGEKGLGKRKQAWEIEHGASLDKAPFHFIDAIPNLLHSDDVVQVIAALKPIQAQMPVRLIVVDTRSQHTVGGDENSNDDAAIFIRNLIKLRKATGAAVAYIHHTGHNEPNRGRGASAGFANVDFSILMKKVDGGVDISEPKAKDWETPVSMRVMVKTVKLGYVNEQTLEDETSAVLVYEGLPRQQRLSKMDEMLVNAIAQAGTESKEDARAQFYALHPGAQDTKRKAFDRAWTKRTKILNALVEEAGHGTQPDI